MKRSLLFLIILMVLPALVYAGFHLGMVGAVKQKVKELDEKVVEKHSIHGTVLNSLGNPIYGAKVTSGKNVTKTGQNGNFSIIAVGGRINVSAFGYYEKTYAVGSGTEEVTISITSRNYDDIKSAAAATDYSSYSNLIQYCGYNINNDPSTSRGFADAHINCLRWLDNLHKSVTLGEIADELAVNNVQIDGSAITRAQFIAVLQGLIDAAYTNLDDPRYFIPLYIISDDQGNIPSAPPTISEWTTISSTKATMLYTSVYSVAQMSQEEINNNFSTYSPSKSLKQKASREALAIDPEYIAAGVTSLIGATSLEQAEHPDTGEYLARSVGGWAGRQVGLIAAYSLVYLSHGALMPALPYMVVGFEIAGWWAGNQVATLLYKIFMNWLGEPRIEEIESAKLTEEGDFSVSCDMRVTLTWEGGPLTDVDLHVTDPNGEECYFLHMTTAIGGELDVDDVDGYGPENFTLRRGETIGGDYKVEVNFYDDEGAIGEPIQATIVIHLNEGTTNEITRTFGPHTITECDYMGSNPNAWWSVTTIRWPGGTFSSSASLPRYRSLSIPRK